MKIRTRKHDHLYLVKNSGNSRAQFLRALKKYRENNPLCRWYVSKFTYSSARDCFTIEKCASYDLFRYWDGSIENLGYHIDEDKLREYIDNRGGYFVFGEVGENIRDVIDIINKREGKHLAN